MGKLETSKAMVKLFDFRFVYLIKSSSGRMKVGIARCIPTRLQKIDKTTPNSSEKLVMYCRCFGAAKVERRMHKRLKAIHKPYVGSGRTEYFKTGLRSTVYWWSVLMEVFLRRLVNIVVYYSFWIVGTFWVLTKVIELM